MKHILIISLVFVAVWQDEILSTTRSKLFSLKGRQSSNKCRIWLMTHKNGGSVWGTEDRISWENRTKFPWDGNFNEISRWERTPSRRDPKLSTSPFEEQDSGDRSSIVFSVHSKNFQHIFFVSLPTFWWYFVVRSFRGFDDGFGIFVPHRRTARWIRDRLSLWLLVCPICVKRNWLTDSIWVYFWCVCGGWIIRA